MLDSNCLQLALARLVHLATTELGDSLLVRHVHLALPLAL